MIMAEPGQTIRININDFSLEEDDQNCTRYDFLEFRDGDSVDAPSLGGKFCGSNYPKRVGPSTSNVMTVVFHTDIGRVARGFNLTWKLCGAGDQLGSCDASTNFSGTLQSVNYPAEYPSGRDTFWHFVATHPTRRFSITFTDFELESSYGTCSYDTLKISDPSGIEEGPFCGDTMPAPFGPTAGSQLTVNLYTDSSSQFRGFSADWTGTCNTGTSSSSTEEM
ncbi:zinc metalloproteinase nas-39-like [Amphibalanus amphitrite]|nr:zinc metalloproteinase nas-39-like [Amphibalanus amphitrite]